MGTNVIDQIKTNAKVDSISDERNNGDGFWVYLKKPFWNDDLECRIIHESSPTKCLQILKSKVIIEK